MIMKMGTSGDRRSKIIERKIENNNPEHNIKETTIRIRIEVKTTE